MDTTKNRAENKDHTGAYAIGLLLAVVLTVVAFGLVMSAAAIPPWVRLSGIFTAAALQMVVHLRCFLHLDMSPTGRWNLLSLLFTVLILVLFVGGTLWIMFDLGSRMM